MRKLIKQFRCWLKGHKKEWLYQLHDFGAGGYDTTEWKTCRCGKNTEFVRSWNDMIAEFKKSNKEKL